MPKIEKKLKHHKLPQAAKKAGIYYIYKNRKRKMNKKRK